MELDYEQVAAELVRALRGTRSQTAFARRIGVQPNTVYGWEAGRRSLTASRAFAVGERVGVGSAAVVRRFLRGAAPPWLDEIDLRTPEGVATLLRDLRGTTPIGQLADRVGRSRYAMSRWLSGEAEPRLPDLLRAVEATTSRVLDLLAAWVDPSALPSVHGEWERLERHRRLLFEAPWATAVLRSLELESYRTLPEHDPAWIADLLGLPVPDVARWLGELERAGRLRRDGPRWAPAEGPPWVDPAAGARLREHWASVGLDRIRAEAPGLFSYSVFTASEADHARLRELHVAYVREVRAIAATSAPAERILAVNVQLFALDSEPPSWISPVGRLDGSPRRDLTVGARALQGLQGSDPEG